MNFIKKLWRYTLNKYYGHHSNIHLYLNARKKLNNPVVFLEGLKKNSNSEMYTLNFKQGYSITCLQDHLPIVGETCILEDYGSKNGSKIKPGDIVFDVGAHIGSFAVYAANKGATVYAFEPHETNFEFLKKNIALNQLKNIYPFKLGIWHTAGELSLGSPDTNSGGSSVFKQDGTQQKIAVQTLSEAMAAHGVKKIDVLKMDIEGAEYEIFSHMNNETFRKIKSIIAEYHLMPGRDHLHYSYLKNILEKQYRTVIWRMPYYIYAEDIISPQK